MHYRLATSSTTSGDFKEIKRNNLKIYRFKFLFQQKIDTCLHV